MFNFFTKHRLWKLSYTYRKDAIELNESDRFLTLEEAERRFQRMSQFHNNKNEIIIEAYITGPRGFQKELIA